jgi:hypothetical protein
MAVPGALYAQDPDDELIYTMDWTDFLNGEATIVSSAWTVTEPSGDAITLTATNPSVLDGDLMAQALMSGGEVGKKYRVHNEVTLTGNPTQTVERSFYIRVAQR